MPLIDNGVYVGGRRIADPASLTDTFELMRARGGMAWIGLYRPDQSEIEAVAREFGLHPLSVEDAISAHQRAKLERYGDVLFTVLRPARYLDDVERIEFGELHVFTGRDFVVTIRHAEKPDLHAVRQRLEHDPALLCLGPEAVLYAILDQVVDEYAPVVAGLQNDVDEIEDQLFHGTTSISQRIYELSREAIAFQRSTKPLTEMLVALERGFDKYGVEEELRTRLRDVHDHAIRVAERVDGLRVLLQNALTVQTTLVAQQQNEEMRALTQTSLAQNEEVKRISAWAAIFFAPTLVGTIYGMNFTHMPELAWQYGYPFALVLMVALSVVLWWLFRRRGWL